MGYYEDREEYIIENVIGNKIIIEISNRGSEKCLEAFIETFKRFLF